MFLLVISFISILDFGGLPLGDHVVLIVPFAFTRDNLFSIPHNSVHSSSSYYYFFRKDKIPVPATNHVARPNHTINLSNVSGISLTPCSVLPS